MPGAAVGVRSGAPPGCSGRMLTSAPSRRASFASRSASASASFTPPIITYSNVTRLRNASAARNTASRSYFFSIGMMPRRWAGVVAWSEIASRNCSGRSASSFMPGQDADGGDGDVAGADAEPVGRVEDGERDVHRRQLSNGSPMPMNTMLVGLSSGERRAISRTCPAISNGVRFRRYPMRPVAQKEQPSAQPAWDEMQSVRREPLGMSTDSTASPSARRQRYLRVPSADCWMTSAWSRGRGWPASSSVAEGGGQLGGRRPARDRRHPEATRATARSGSAAGHARPPTPRARIGPGRE